jgi:hypothetical protein
MKLSLTPPPSSAERIISVGNSFVTNAANSSERSVAMSVLTRAGDVEAQDAEADGNQAGAGEIFAILVQAQHENNSRDDPTVAKEAGAPGRNGDHEVKMS